MQPERMRMISYARVCIEIKATQVLTDSIDVLLNGQTRVIKVEYERMPAVCALCGMFGHKYSPPIVIRSDNKGPSEMMEHDGVWKKVTKGRGKPSTAATSEGILIVMENTEVQNVGAAPVDDVPQDEQVPEMDQPDPIPSSLVTSLAASDSDSSVGDTVGDIASDPEEEPSTAPQNTRGRSIIRMGARVLPDKPEAPVNMVLEPATGSSSSPPLANAPTPKKKKRAARKRRSKNLSCIGIVETKVKMSRFENLSAGLMSGWLWISNYDYSPRGRIWLGWDPWMVAMEVQAKSAQAIHSYVRLLASNKACYVSVIYGDHTFVSRRTLWADPVQSSVLFAASPWLVAGDFNAIRDDTDRLGSSNAWIPAFDEFATCLTQRGLEDLRYIGHRFTWSTSSGPQRKQRKIDRVLVNARWYLEFSYSKARLALTSTQDAITLDPFNQMLAIQEKEQLATFAELRLQEESFYRQKSQVKWLREGDQNTKYFHHFVNKRQLSNHIISVVDENGSVITEPGLVRGHIISHFEDLFNGNDPPTRPDVLENRSILANTLDDQQVRFLSRQVTEAEIRNTMFSLAKGKAPGPDGYNVDFFKSSWEIVGPSVVEAIKDFFISGCLLRELNATILTLVPKVPNASTMNDFRPIACCNTVYKCITKIMANRIAHVLPTLISMPQSAFVKGRRISDNILIA
ncbi:uncharacterized protein LOC115752843 [Rhodamnia argentea]|uniref:Uncharacterized protein LOC115752843 n=1 Tax=Rhodamnia argentea TaxID=178133 RepID=A0ABM3HCD0_9MYRT|nr:uncharacterized protein LOC115752843 [Rhodamnia argentea]